MNSGAPNFANKFYQLGLVGRVERWLYEMPHPSVVVEISPTHVAAARWGKQRGDLEASAVEYLTEGVISPSPIEPNITKPEIVRLALQRVFESVSVPPRSAGIALLIPDPVVRVFILPFESLPRRKEEALPMLRWRLKKSVPFDVDETVVSWMRQISKGNKLEVIAAIARQRIIREYEEIAESLGAHAGVVLSSALAMLPLLEDRGATLCIRRSGPTMTTVIVQGGNLCVYRSSEMSADAALLNPQAILDETFPAIAYYQDTWGETVDRARISGFGTRSEVFSQGLSEELKCPVAPLSEAEKGQTFGSAARELLQQELEPLAGWMLNGGA